MAFSTYTQRYAQYFLRRGYDLDAGGWSILKRALWGSWSQPGFHRFWQVWCPEIGYLLFQLYLHFGGNKKRVRATLKVFLLIGLVLDVLLMALCGSFCIVFSVTFLLFGLLTLLSRAVQPWLQQHRWPAVFNLAMNVALVVGTLDVAIAVQRFLTT